MPGRSSFHGFPVPGGLRSLARGGWGTKAGFELARRALRSKVEDSDIDPLELSPEKIGTFDLVLCLGVLYHMRHPLLALEPVASVTRGRLILQTQVDWDEGIGKIGKVGKNKDKRRGRLQN